MFCLLSLGWLIVNDAPAFFNGSAKQADLGIKLEKNAVLWDSGTGRGEVLVSIAAHNDTDISYEGDLRIIILSIQQRIDFKQLTIQPLFCENVDALDCPLATGSYVYKTELQAHSEIDKQLSIKLPPDTCFNETNLQFVVMFQGYDKDGKKRVLKDMFLFKHLKTFTKEVPLKSYPY